jgi:hypothetical protein
MRRSAFSTRTTARIVAVVGGAWLVACKGPSPAAPPAEPGLRDDIAAIEAQLERNADDLEAEGILVARAPQAPPPAITQQAPREEADAAAEREEDDAPAADRPAPRDRSREGYWSRWLAKRERKKNQAEHCQRICDLAEATCGLADRICELGQRHPDEVRYEEACRRAEHHCRVAAEACTACVE